MAAAVWTDIMLWDAWARSFVALTSAVKSSGSGDGQRG